MKDRIIDSFNLIFGDNDKTNPLFTPFVLFWLAVNWRIVFILLFASELSMIERIHLIESKHINIWMNYGYPLTFSIISIIIIPKIRFNYEVWQEKNKRIKTKACIDSEIIHNEKEIQLSEAKYNVEYVKKYGMKKEGRHVLLSMKDNIKECNDYLIEIDKHFINLQKNEFASSMLKSFIRDKAVKTIFKDITESVMENKPLSKDDLHIIRNVFGSLENLAKEIELKENSYAQNIVPIRQAITPIGRNIDEIKNKIENVYIN